MVLINKISDAQFTLNGVPYVRIFQVLQLGIDNLGLYSIYDNNLQILGATPFTDIVVDGVSFETIEEAMIAINKVINNETITGDYVLTTDPRLSDARPATRLATPVQVFGNEFDATSDISGKVTCEGVASSQLVEVSTFGKTLKLGSQNSGLCHYDTTAAAHYFNKPVRVNGDVLGGTSYNRRLAYIDESNLKNQPFRNYTTNPSTYMYIYEQDVTANVAKGILGTAIGYDVEKVAMTLFYGMATIGADKIPDRPLDVVGSGIISGDLHVNGTITSGGSSSSSDERLKEDVTPLKTALDYILSTQYVSYKWKIGGAQDVGVIAQTEQVREFDHLVKVDARGLLSYDYEKHSILIGRALQEMHELYSAKIQELQQQIKQLKNNATEQKK